MQGGAKRHARAMNGIPAATPGWGTALRTAFALLLLSGVAVLANRVGAGAGGALALPIEPFAVLAILLALGALGARRSFHASRILVTLVALLVLVLAGADASMRAAASRGFNVLRDLDLVVDGWRMLSGTLGTGPAAWRVTAAALALLVFGALVFWSLGALFVLGRARRPFAAIALAVLVAALSLLAMNSARHGALRLQTPVANYLTAHVDRGLQTFVDQRAFARALTREPLAGLQPPALLAALADTRVMILFVESYGRSALADPRYAATLRPRLAQIDGALHTAGLSACSGWLESPTLGGQSWLAHATLLSGLWVDNSARYRRLIASDRVSLNKLFARAGWTTVAVMPAITLDWPEAQWFGYDHVFAADDLGYRGEAFNWVTMPDQYTLSAIERLTRDLPAPVMVEAALISSHAPWTPIPEMVPWDAVGDGSIFTPQARRGDTPAVVWRDPERVRAQYRRALDYALTAVGSYMARHGDDTLFVVVGDHQPAPLITGAQATRDVPIHIVSDDARLLSRLDPKYWQAGMTPPADAAVARMDTFRERFVRAMSHGRKTPPRAPAPGRSCAVSRRPG